LSLHNLLQANDSTLADFPALPQLSDFPNQILLELSNNPLIRRETAYDTQMLQKVNSRESLMNDQQRHVYDTVLRAVNTPGPRGKLFFLDGPGGTGKSFVLEQILARVRLDRKIAIAVASSGIAALLLTGGRTAHSTFKLPINPVRGAACNISAQSHRAQLLRDASIIVWDEVSMAHKLHLESLDLTLRDLTGVDAPFGGKVILLAGDFRQTLPVIKKATIGETIEACFKSSELWEEFVQLRLTINMRVANALDPSRSREIADFAEFLLMVGEGRHPVSEARGPDFMALPSDMMLKVPEPERDCDESIDHELATIVDAVYAQVGQSHLHDSYFDDRAILTTTNTQVHRVNEEVSKRMVGRATEYLSTDTVESDEPEAELLYETEYLNGLSVSGLPPHKLTLKIGSTVMMIRNLNSDLGLCNGTRLRVTQLSRNCIKATIMTGVRDGQPVLIPRIIFKTEATDFPFILRRKQFPVIPAFAMTINKSQGQSIRHLGLYLPTPVFAHGQLYVALSRVTARENIKVVCGKDYFEDDHDTQVYTKNIVFQQILQ